MPRLAEGVRGIAQQGKRSAGIRRPDEGAKRVVTDRNARTLMLLQPVDNKRIGEALRFIGPIELGRATDEHGNVTPLHFIKHTVGHFCPDLSFPSPGAKRVSSVCGTAFWGYI